MLTSEINKGENYAGFKEALGLVLSNTQPGRMLNLPLADCIGHVAAGDIKARIDSPSDSASLKDGFAVKSRDIEQASFASPARLEIVGSVFAGGRFEGTVKDGEAIKICTGSPVPEGTDAVVVAELCEEIGKTALVKNPVKPGKNILCAGEDVAAGVIVIKKGDVLLPARLALAAAGGISELPVYAKPGVALIAIGDEIATPGKPLKEGQLYASNLVNLGTWLSCFNVPYLTMTAKDDVESIKHTLLEGLKKADVVMTSGGAWASERDMVVSVLDELGWEKIFHYVRMGPGKGITFGLFHGKPVFCLPGSPPSNDMAFLQLALPGVLHLAGMTGSALPIVKAELTANIKSRNHNWAEFKKGKLNYTAGGNYQVTPYSDNSRLKLIADANCLICKPEDRDDLSAGDLLDVQVMLPAFGGLSVGERS